jgi:hypothetical protein
MVHGWRHFLRITGRESYQPDEPMTDALAQAREAALALRPLPSEGWAAPAFTRPPARTAQWWASGYIPTRAGIGRIAAR